MMANQSTCELTVTVVEMEPLTHIYRGFPPFMGQAALCGHPCRDPRTARRHDPSRRHCAACQAIAEEGS